VPDIEDCLHQVMAIRGALGASLIDFTNGLTVGAIGRGPGGDPHTSAGGTADLVTATVHSGAFAGQGRPGHIEDIIVTAGNGYHLVHFVGTGYGARWVLYVWLDRMLGNLAITQRALRSIATAIVAA